MSKVAEGSFIKINYSAKKVSDGSVFDTNIENKAKQSGIFEEKKIYEPLLLVIGKNWFPPKFEQELIGREVGEKLNFKLAYLDAFGPHDPSKIKLVSRREFQKVQINPQKGQWVTVGDQEGLVLQTNSSRVRIDFNHKLAGEDIEYEVEILEILDSLEERLQAIIGRRLPGAFQNDAEISIDDGKIEIKLPERVKYFEYIQFAKDRIAKEVYSMMENVKHIRYIEDFPKENS